MYKCKHESGNVKSLVSFLYTLKAVVLHYGTHSNGHFITIRKCRIDGVDEWFSISDSRVERVDETFINGCGRFVYLLFYER